MTHTFTKLLAASCMAMACSAFAAGPIVPVQGAPGAAGTPAAPAANASQFLADLKAKLKISGPAQEQAWAGFAAASEHKIDVTTFQELTRAKTAPELMNGLEKMQTQAAKRFGEQKKVIIGLYDVLGEEQRKTFDMFVFAAMARMGAPAAAR